MNRDLRRRHRFAFGFLALALPAGLVAGLAVRSDPPAAGQQPEFDSSLSGRVLLESSELWGRLPLNTRISDPGGGLTVELAPRRSLRRPALLLYWSAAASDSGRLPADSRLLGAFAGTHLQAFGLPREAAQVGGRLILYSLGHQEIVASARIPPQAEGGGGS